MICYSPPLEGGKKRNVFLLFIALVTGWIPIHLSLTIVSLVFYLLTQLVRCEKILRRCQVLSELMLQAAQQKEHVRVLCALSHLILIPITHFTDEEIKVERDKQLVQDKHKKTEMADSQAYALSKACVKQVLNK